MHIWAAVQKAATRYKRNAENHDCLLEQKESFAAADFYSNNYNVISTSAERLLTAFLNGDVSFSCIAHFPVVK